MALVADKVLVEWLELIKVRARVGNSSSNLRENVALKAVYSRQNIFSLQCL
jgi:hypothetical protein